MGHQPRRAPGVPHLSPEAWGAWRQLPVYRRASLTLWLEGLAEELQEDKDPRLVLQALAFAKAATLLGLVSSLQDDPVPQVLEVLRHERTWWKAPMMELEALRFDASIPNM